MSERVSRMDVRDMAMVRRIILQVIDDGKLLHGGSANPWSFYPHDSDWQEPGERNLAHRMDFVDAIQAAIMKEIGPDEAQLRQIMAETESLQPMEVER